MKVLNEQGLQYLWKCISLEDYPNNETLIAVLNAIDETKADKNALINMLLKTEQTLTAEEIEQVHKNLQLENLVTMEQMNTAIEAAINAIVFQTYYTGNIEPDSSLGEDGDLYLVRG